MAAVLVHIDLDGERPDPWSLVALAAGRQLASAWGATLYAAMISAADAPGLTVAQAALAQAGADKIVVATTTAPIAPLWACVGHAWQRVLEQLRPRVVLFGADAPAAPELAPRTAARIGARLLARARTWGGDDIELRDRDGMHARVGDSGAAVALIGRAECARLAERSEPDFDLDVIVLASEGEPDTRVELAARTAAELGHALGAIVVLGEDAASDAATASAAKTLADALGAPLLAAGSVDKTTPLSPAVCVVIGTAQLDVAGASSLVEIRRELGLGDIAAQLEDA